MCQLDHMHPTDQKLISAALTLRAKEQDEGFIVAMAMLGQCFVLVCFFFTNFVQIWHTLTEDGHLSQTLRLNQQHIDSDLGNSGS